jgi:hypothetical protein
MIVPKYLNCATFSLHRLNIHFRSSSFIWKASMYIYWRRKIICTYKATPSLFSSNMAVQFSYLEVRRIKDLCQRAVMLRGSMAFLSPFRRYVITDQDPLLPRPLQFIHRSVRRHTYRARWLDSNALDLSSRFSRFESRPGLSWCNTDLLGKCMGFSQIRPRPLPST